MTTCHGGACRGLLALGLAVSVHLPLALAAEPNYDEAAVRAYTLPDVLVGSAGTAATTADEWQSISRPHQFALLEKSVYGQRLPAVLRKSPLAARSAAVAAGGRPSALVAHTACC